MADGKSEVPALFGIDPDCLYKWTPRDGREEIEPAKYEGGGKSGKMLEPAKYGAALPDAPVVVLAPLTEAQYLKVSHAQEVYRRARAKDPENAEEAYSPELQAEILTASIKEFRNLKSPSGRELKASGDPEKDLTKIRPFRLELFFDIIAGNAYSTEDVQGFTSPQGSQPA